MRKTPGGRTAKTQRREEKTLFSSFPKTLVTAPKHHTVQPYSPYNQQLS
jgi:hypothetical protein